MHIWAFANMGWSLSRGFGRVKGRSGRGDEEGARLVADDIGVRAHPLRERIGPGRGRTPDRYSLTSETAPLPHECGERGPVQAADPCVHTRLAARRDFERDGSELLPPMQKSVHGSRGIEVRVELPEPLLVEAGEAPTPLQIR
jgi:hypothetical protein